MNNRFFEQYAALEVVKRDVEEKQRVIKDKIQAELEVSKEDKAEGSTGYFRLMFRKTWDYSLKVKAEELALKKLKKVEEEDGTAGLTTSNTISFYAKKFTNGNGK